MKFIIVVLFLTKISAYSEIQTTPSMDISSITDDYDDYDDSSYDCCNGTCPIASISVDVSNGTLLNLVCITCTTDFDNFTITWMMNGSVINSINKDSKDIGIAKGNSSSVITQVQLNRYDYDNTNITCKIVDKEGSDSDDVSIRQMNERYNTILALEATNKTVKFKDIDSYTITNENIIEN